MKKHLSKRVAALTMTAAMSVGLLAGCGGSDTPPSSTGSGDDEITTLIWYMSINPVAADTERSSPS